MRSLCSALLLLALVLCLSLWRDFKVSSTIESLSCTAHRAVTPDTVNTLSLLWKKQKNIISLSVNRRLVTDAEKSLALMQAHQHDKDPAPFYSARTAFLQTLKNIRSSCSISFESII